MRLPSTLLLPVLISLFAVNNPGWSQEVTVYLPPAPATKLEMLETNIGTILIKATTLIGSMNINGASISVICKADTDVGSGRKEYGVAISLMSPHTDNQEDRTIIDYDELASLLSAIGELAKIDWTGISLNSFSASYQTAGGFRMVAFSARRSGSIEHSVRSSRMARGIVLTPSQLAEFHSLVDQARRKLDDLRAK